MKIREQLLSNSAVVLAKFDLEACQFDLTVECPWKIEALNRVKYS